MRVDFGTWATCWVNIVQSDSKNKKLRLLDTLTVFDLFFKYLLVYFAVTWLRCFPTKKNWKNISGGYNNIIIIFIQIINKVNKPLKTNSRGLSEEHCRLVREERYHWRLCSPFTKTVQPFLDYLTYLSQD